MSNEVSVHIFEPVIKKLGFDTFKCTKKEDASCYSRKRSQKCPWSYSSASAERNRWLGVFMGETSMGLLTLDDEGMLRFKSAGNNQYGLNHGAKIGKIVDPKSFDKIGRRILRTATKRVPLEIRDEMQSMERTFDWTVSNLDSLYDTLKDFLDTFRFTVKKWKGINRVGEKTGVPVQIETEIQFESEDEKGDIKDVELTLKKPQDLMAFIEAFSRKQRVIQQIVEIFDEISKEVID